MYEMMIATKSTIDESAGLMIGEEQLKPEMCFGTGAMQEVNVNSSVHSLRKLLRIFRFLLSACSL